MKKFEKLKVIIIVICIVLMVGVMFVGNAVWAKDEVSMHKSYPASYTQDSLNDYKNLKDNDLGIDIKYPSIFEQTKYDRKIGSEDLKNIINITDQESDFKRFDLEVIPLKSKSEDSALKVLESYIINYVGIIEKSNQKTFNLNNFDAAQIGYNLFECNGDFYYRVYTILKKDNKSWLTSFAYSTKYPHKDPFNFQSMEGKVFLNILETFKTLDKSSDDLFNSIDLSKVDKVWIDEYIKNNIKFETNIL